MATINSASVQENLKEIATAIRSLDLRPTIQVSINKTTDYGSLFRILFGLGFEGISLDAQEIENVETIKTSLEVLEQVCEENNISERNTILLKNKEIRDALGDFLTEYNILTIVSIDEETHAAKIEEGYQLKAKDKGYLRGRKLINQKIDAGAINIKSFVKIIVKKIFISCFPRNQRSRYASGLNRRSGNKTH